MNVCHHMYFNIIFSLILQMRGTRRNSSKSMIRHIFICGYPSIMISNQVIFDLFSSLIGKNPDEDTRLSAMRRSLAEAGVEEESSKEMFEKIMGRAQMIHSEIKPLGGPARKKVLSHMWTIPLMTPQVEVESEVRSYREVVRLYFTKGICICSVCPYLFIFLI